MAVDERPKGQSPIVRYLLCIFIHKIILLILHGVLLWIGYTVIELGYELANRLDDLDFLIGDMSHNGTMLKVTGIVLMVGTVLFGLPALLSEKKILLKVHMYLLAIIGPFLAFFLYVLYAGAESTTTAEANRRYASAFEKAKVMQDVDGINYVMRVERQLKCCGMNSSKDYEYGVLESCCTTTPPCQENNIFKVGCAKALNEKLRDTLSDIADVLNVAIFFIFGLLIYLFFFGYLLNRKAAHNKKIGLREGGGS